MMTTLLSVFVVLAGIALGFNLLEAISRPLMKIWSIFVVTLITIAYIVKYVQ